MSTSMWKIDEAVGGKTPALIMGEQAQALTQETSGRLRGHVSVVGSPGQIITEFRVTAPTLNNYSYVLVTYTHGLTGMFPGQLVSEVSKLRTQVDDLSIFENRLLEVIQSKPVNDLIRTLLDSVRAARNGF